MLKGTGMQRKLHKYFVDKIKLENEALFAQIGQQDS